MRKFIVLIFICLSFCSFATHNRAGEITYSRVAPFTNIVGGSLVQVYNYTFTVTKYTNDGDDVADRCEDSIFFGDGTFQLIKRTNGGASACPTCAPCDCGPPCGVIIIEDNNFRVKVNTYTVSHQYPGPGTYIVRSTDPMRNDGVINMYNSGQVPFYIESLLIINSFTGANSSPVFTYLPTDKACVGKCFYHNPGAYDADGDSLSYELTIPRSSGTSNVPNYVWPNQYGGTFSINPTSGILSWCAPPIQAVFNIAFIVKEWRKNTSKNYQLVGYVLRDMQVIVQTCANNPPLVTVPNDTCVEAGTFISKNILVTDPENNVVKLEGNGGAFSTVSPKALLTNGTGTAPFTADFSWQTSCDHIRQQPYMNVFKAEDQLGPVKLTYYATYNIKVVPPSVKNVSATPIGSTIKITWQLSNCFSVNNPIISYNVYRKNDCIPFIYEPCKTGISPGSGFSLIGQTTSSVLIDNNAGNGLTVGQDYSYVVIAVYNDGSQSYSSSQVCAKLKRDVPILLNVDILSTATSGGSVYVRWSRPLKGDGGFDSLLFPGPYEFKLKYRAGNTGSFSPLVSFTKNFIFQLDTEFVHTNVNTIDSDQEYEIEFIAGTTSIGSSQKATSVFLSASPGDRKVELQWAATTPWNNYQYTVFRKGPGAGFFSAIGTTNNKFYTDNNVVNKSTYCYKILSEGQYSDPSVYKPLLNNSQEVCAKAIDTSIPCTPTINITANCPAGFLKVEWNNVALTCSDDVLKYVLFKKETIDGDYFKLDTLYGSNSTSFSFDGLNLISSCFAIQSVDSAGNASILSTDYCVDNCPEFELPNIITVNGDGVNDFFKAIKVRQVKEIDLTVFDRWGNLIYKTKDPYFNWNGTSLLTNKIVSEGTFFYICDVYEPGIKGIKKRNLKGYLQVVR